MTSASVTHTWGLLLAVVLAIQGVLGLTFDRLELITFTQVWTTICLFTCKKFIELQPVLTLSRLYL